MGENVSALFFVPNKVQNNLSSFFNTDNAGVQADIVIIGITPGAAGVMLVIKLATFIFFLKSGNRGLFRFTVQTDNSVCTKI